jgi:hypothetical protein
LLIVYDATSIGVAQPSPSLFSAAELAESSAPRNEKREARTNGPVTGVTNESVHKFRLVVAVKRKRNFSRVQRGFVDGNQAAALHAIAELAPGAYPRPK